MLKDGIGLRLCEAANDQNKAKGKDSFFHKRIASAKNPSFPATGQKKVWLGSILQVPGGCIGPQ